MQSDSAHSDRAWLCISLQDACDVPSPKKQCGSTGKTKDKSSPTKDPQSIAAKVPSSAISTLVIRICFLFSFLPLYEQLHDR